MGNREVNYLHILPQVQPPKHLSVPCNSPVKIDVNVYNDTTTNDQIHKKWFKILLHISQTSLRW